MPKHYKEMIDEIINKMDEDAPANAVAHGGVDMNPTGKKPKEKKPDILKRLGKNIKENNDNNNIVLKGVLNKISQIETAIDGEKPEVKFEDDMKEASMSKVYKKRAPNGDMDIFYRGNTKYGMNKQIGYFHKDGSYLSVYHDNEDDKDDFTQNDQAKNDRDAITMIYQTAISNKVIREEAEYKTFKDKYNA
tara:strand:- start:179 stop:751 length:573 start_codon:yes stop_codon:yes gene_type:complete